MKDKIAREELEALARRITDIQYLIQYLPLTAVTQNNDLHSKVEDVCGKIQAQVDEFNETLEKLNYRIELLEDKNFACKTCGHVPRGIN